MIRVVHYLNQFFGGIGGEDKAGAPLQVHDGAVGSGRALAALLEGEAEIVRTLVCGDNAFHADPEGNLDAALAAVAEAGADLVLAGPAFNAGRYGLACGAVGAGAGERLGIPAVTGLYPEAPAVDVYRSRVVMAAAADSAAGMRPALEGMVRIGLRLARGGGLLPAEEDGRIPMGYRAGWVVRTPAAVRALDMLAAKLSGGPYTSEIGLPARAEPAPPAPAVADLSDAVVAAVTEGGLVPEGNPDRIESSGATRWARYPVSMFEGGGGPAFRSVHAGYDTRWVDADPNRLVPIDALRSLEKEGVIGELHDYVYVTTGTGTAVTEAERMGGEMARRLLADGVQAVIATST